MAYVLQKALVNTAMKTIKYKCTRCNRQPPYVPYTCECCKKFVCNECIVWYWGVPFEDDGISGFVDPETPVCLKCDKKVNRVRDLIEKAYSKDPTFRDREKELNEKFRKCCKEH